MHDGQEGQRGVRRVSKERLDRPEGVPSRSKGDHFRSRMSRDRSKLTRFPSKGSRLPDSRRLFLWKLSPFRDILRHFPSNLRGLVGILRGEGSKGAKGRAFAAHSSWKVPRDVSFMTVDRDREAQKPDPGVHDGSKVIRGVEVGCLSPGFVGQNRGFDRKVVSSP